MIPGCHSTLAGQCVSWTPVQVIMATILGCAALLALNHWLMEVGE